MPNQPKKGNPLNNYAKYSGIGIQMFAIIGIGSYIGIKLDDHYNNEGSLWTIILSLTSTIVAVVFVIRRIIANSKDDK
ncbi:AtpZ/AtpI family protein [Gelidibacter pelagius]|uniref:AtpZ/AtpI family protein n=1 Tax=Gelidibacter pelagius TaxID=2819985 RepID=A0ABS3SLY8_9FLAO|nr:AtpZ/AtpI family protein [Gelidibacter pelagius]MBO3096723.1 AtpZ/AtpI family protein [Gelidibacter pelagius]